MRKLVAIGILLFAVYLTISLGGSIWNLWKKRGELDIARSKVDNLKQENNRLQSELEYVQSEEFVERQAREKLNYVKPGEAIVVIPDSVLKAATASAAPTPPSPNWQQWLRLFF